MGYGKKNGRRTETCNHYAYATDKTPYLTKTEVIRYDDANVAYKQSITDYEVIEVSGKYMGTRIISNTTNIQKGTDVGATTVYQYKGATDRQYETVIEPQVIPVAREGQSNGPVQLKRYYEYDNQGRIKLEKTYTGESPATYIAATHYEYTHAGGHLTKQYSVSSQSPAEQLDVTEWRYNGFGEIYLTKSPDGVVSGKTYDASGRLASEFILNDPSLYTTFTTYATLKSAISQATLDQRPRVISLTHYYYDSNNRLEYVKQAKADYSFPYCLPEETADNVTWVVTQYSYDTYGRKTETIQDATGVALTTTYVYDNLGRLEKTILPNKKYTKTERNGRGLTKRQIVGYMSGTSEVPVAVTEFKYDANGNVIEEKFPDGTRIQKQYDDLDRLKKVYKGVIAN
jgi:YD repeat-containing protein